MFNLNNILIVLAFIFYLLVMILIGFFYMKKTKNSEDYFLGGRGLSGKVAALSAQASDMSGWLLMGLPGSVYALGTGQSWIAIGLFIGTALNWIIVAKRLRRYTIKANNSLTLPEFFSNRFHDEKKILLLVSSIVIAIFFLVYSASALASGGKLFSTVFGIDYKIALTIGAIVILLYTFMGGFMAVCITDFIQGLLMLVALMVVPVVAYALICNNGGMEMLLSKTSVGNEYVNILYNGENKMSFIDILSQLAWGLGYFGMPHILVRFMAIKNEDETKKSQKIAIIWVLISLFFAILIGVIGRAYLSPTVLGITNDISSESVFIEMIKKIFIEDYKLAFIAGLFLSGILAAIMSTADSQLLVTASSVSKDIYKGFIFKEASDKKVLFVSRVSVIVISILAYIIAYNPNSSIMGLVSNAWAGFGSAFGPLVLLSLFWKRTNFYGALIGIISGGLLVVIWDYIPFVNGMTLGSYTGIYSLLIGFIVSLLFIVIVSLLTKPPIDIIKKEFYEVKNNNL